MMSFCTTPFPNTSLRISHFLSSQAATYTPRAKMSSSSSLISPTPENSIVLGCGSVVVDLLAAVASYPKPDDKIRSTSFQVRGGGNAGNALTCAARLGLNPRLISKVADDAQGRGILEELEADGVNTSFIVVGCGGASMDYLVMVDGFPKPDEKIRGCISKVQGGGNVGNALTCAARLGLRPRIITKVAEDTEGRSIIEELEADGVDTSFTVVSKEGRSMYSYVIVDSKMKSRTAIYYPGYPPMVPTDFSSKSLTSALDGAKLVYFDGLSLETAFVVAGEACHKNIPILVDAEMGEEGFDNLLNMADYAVCSAKYPQAWTKAPSMPSALVSMLMRLSKLKFVIVTLGEEGCIMLQRYIVSAADDAQLEEMNVDQCLASLNQKKDSNTTNPTCISSPLLKLEAPGLGTLVGRLLVGTAERIPHLELVDTTGAGDAFIGAVLYALCTDMLPEKMLPFAAQVAASCCRAFGARTGLPLHTNPRSQLFLDDRN